MPQRDEPSWRSRARRKHSGAAASATLSASVTRMATPAEGGRTSEVDVGEAIACRHRACSDGGGDDAARQLPAHLPTSAAGIAFTR